MNTSRTRVTALVCALFSALGVAAYAVHTTNANDQLVQSLSQDHIGLAHSTAPNTGANVTLAISPYQSQLSSSPNRAKVMIGPAALVRTVAASAAAGNWHWYR